MAHFAELDQTSTVLQVIVVDNSMTLDANNQESEQVGIAYCHSLFGENTQWMQTSYNGTTRKNFAGIGFTYDAQRDAFIAPQPEGEGWVFDEETCQWRNPEAEAAQAAVQTGVTRV